MSFEKLKKLFGDPKYLLLILIAFYFLTRLINLTNIPLFNDESTYIRYGMHQLNEPAFKPYSLLIGKEPLMPELFAIVGSAVGNLLVGARLVSILSGLLTLIGLYVLALKLDSKRIAGFVGMLYILSPFNLFFDRFALLDSGVSAIAIWSLYLTYLIIQKPKWWMGIVLGIVIGAGLYLKTNSFFYLVLPLISIASVFIIKKEEIAIDKILSLKVLSLGLVTTLIIYIPLYFSEFYKIHLQLLKQYTYPLTSVFEFPVKVWMNNGISLFSWLILFLTIPIFILGVYGLLKNVKNTKYLFVIFWLVFPLLYQILFEKLFTSRHVLPLTIPLIFFAAWALDDIFQKKKIYYYITIFIVVSCCLFYDFFIWFKPSYLPNLYFGSAKADIYQYFSGFSSGYGVVEAINYLQSEASGRRIIVITRNDHGNPEDAVVAYLGYNPNVSIGLIADSGAVKQIYDQVAGRADIYFVSRGAYYLGLEKNLIDEKKFLKPDGVEFVGVYKVKY